jgi:hypothetical protein
MRTIRIPAAASVIVVGLASMYAPPHAAAQPPAAARPAPVPAAPKAAAAAPPTAQADRPIELPSLRVEPPPAEAQLGIPIYPTAQFIRSFDAGHGQRYYLFGAQASFTEIVNYYRTILKQRGELVFERPATHAFDVGRFREETMAFPPGVTVKDYAGTGSAGYPNPKPGGQPPRFATVIQIVPAVP